MPLYRFNSFAPVRQGAYQVKWLVDGEQHMSEVAVAIATAEHEIFITDWQIHPNVHLKRPETGVDSLVWRLDKLLLRKASEGVKIYILLYWEPNKKVLDLGSDFAMSVLKHDNIMIFRHPNWQSSWSDYQWSHHEKLVVVDRSIAFVGGIDLCFGRWDMHAHLLADDHPHHPSAMEKSSSQAGGQYCRWVGKDYGNTFIAGDRTDYDKPLDDILDKESSAPIRTKIPRLPWHDVSCVFTGDAVGDVAKHFIERYNAITQTWAVWLTWRTPKLTEEWDHSVQHTIKNPSANNVRIQVVRSVGSTGMKFNPVLQHLQIVSDITTVLPDFFDLVPAEARSIHTAYLDAIENAKRSIYIENQFFISSLPTRKVGSLFTRVYNQIQDALVKRIAEAKKKNEEFHVMIVVPLKNEFPENWGTKTGSPMESTAYLTYASLFRGEHSLFERLKKQDINPDKYISVYGLRTHEALGEKLVTELIYVHSKVMIVDNRLTIVGSANINDRSMLGSRDSEVCVVIEDQEMIEGKMNGKPFKVGKFSHTLHCHLMNEHLGNLQSRSATSSWDLHPDDPMNREFLQRVSKTAANNTKIYEQVFKGKILPTDNVRDKSELETWLGTKGVAETDPEKAKGQLSQVHGNIVSFPKHFLSGYDDKPALKPTPFDVLAGGTLAPQNQAVVNSHQ